MPVSTVTPTPSARGVALEIVTGRLADGREIQWFDLAPRPDRDLRDLRDLAPLVSTSELRFDPLLNEWVAVASQRQDRIHLPAAQDCPLCPNTADSEIPGGDYDVVVFENRFPSLRGEATVAPTDIHSDFVGRPSGGRCEVVCFSPDHNTSLGQLSRERMELVMSAWTERTRALQHMPGVTQVVPFENRGAEVGVTLHHPHGQIYAYPYVTPRTREHLRNAAVFQQQHGKNLFAERLSQEVRDGSRIIHRTEFWTAFVPFAARWPLEVHIYPNRQVSDLTELSSSESSDFADLYLNLLQRLDALYEAPLPYMMAWHQAPLNEQRHLAYLHVELFSVRRSATKLKYLASSESAMGAFISDVSPESVAATLRSGA